MTGCFSNLADSDDLVLIVFSGETDIWWLKILKPGFRHCFAALHKSHRWVIYDPLAHATELQIHEGFDSVDLEFWFRQRGHAVIRTLIRPAVSKKLTPAPFTCVEAIKRLLGLRTATILTPWQLFKFLQKTPMPDNSDDTSSFLIPNLCQK